MSSTVDRARASLFSFALLGYFLRLSRPHGGRPRPCAHHHLQQGGSPVHRFTKEAQSESEPVDSESSSSDGALRIGGLPYPPFRSLLSRWLRSPAAQQQQKKR